MFTPGKKYLIWLQKWKIEMSQDVGNNFIVGKLEWRGDSWEIPTTIIAFFWSWPWNTCTQHTKLLEKKKNRLSNKKLKYLYIYIYHNRQPTYPRLPVISFCFTLIMFLIVCWWVGRWYWSTEIDHIEISYWNSVEVTNWSTWRDMDVFGVFMDVTTERNTEREKKKRRGRTKSRERESVRTL